MRARCSGQATTRWAGAIGTLRVPISAVVVLLAGLGFLLTPGAPAAAQPPAQGWTTTQAPLPSDAADGISVNPEVYLASTSCPAANQCVAAGWYDDQSSRAWGLIETQSGTSWTKTEAPQPNDAGSGSDQGLWLGGSDCGFEAPCQAVSCPTTTYCIAVGAYETTAGYYLPLVETYSNGAWSAAQAPLPGDVAPGPSPEPEGSLTNVDCTAVASCVAVGSYENSSGHTTALVESLSGTTWTPQAAPMPTQPAATGDFSFLTWITCATASWCMASGEYATTAGNSVPLTETWSGGTWTGGSMPLPSDFATSGGFGQAYGVSCPTTTFCAAAGWYSTTGSTELGFVATLAGGTWSVETAPTPGSTSPEFGVQFGVDCPTVSMCVAAGFYDTGSNEPSTLTTWNGSSWSGMKAPLPSNAAPTQSNGELETVSCPTPSYCMVSGDYSATGDIQTGYVVTLSGGSWSPTQVAMPSNNNPTSDFGSFAKWVTCYSPVACTVVGQYSAASGGGNTQGFLSTWTGAQGYWLDATDGGIFTYPNNTFYGSTGSIKLNKPMVGMDPTPDGQGYWLVASDGGIFTYGDAQFHGSRGGQPLNKPIVGMATTPDGQGYWLVASDGGIFTYGDANYYGSRGGQPINAPIVGMAATPDGGGYWLVGADGGIYSYGDALFHGSTGALKLNKPVVGIAGTPTGLGYWLVASDGGIFNYGDANFYGSTGSLKLNKPVVGMASSPSGLGYWLVASDGGVFNYGDAPFEGSAGSLHLNAPVVGMAGG